MKVTIRLAISIIILVKLSLFVSSGMAQNKDDRQQIIETINSIFNAFIQSDLETLKATHSKNWIGFQANSREIVHGIEGYLKDISFKNAKMTEYQIQDIDVKLYGDIAVVYYIAQWKMQLMAKNVIVTFRARSVDIYKKDGDNWIQEGSNLNYLPTPGFKAPGMEKFYDVKIENELK